MTKDISFLILLLLLLYFCVNFIHPAHDDRFTEFTYVCVFSRQSSSFLCSVFFSFGLSFTDTSWNKNMVILFDNQSNWWLILFPKQSSDAKNFQVKMSVENLRIKTLILKFESYSAVCLCYPKISI